MKNSAVIQTAVEILTETFAKRQVSADKIIKENLLKRKYIGSKDRRNITDLIWGVYRNFEKIDYTLKGGAFENPRAAVIVLLMLQNKNPQELFNGEKYAPICMNDEEKKLQLPKNFPDFVKAECPEFLFNLIDKKELEALKSTAPVDVRARIDKKKLLKLLKKEGVEAEEMPINPYSIRIKNRADLNKFKGLLEIQDAGSVALVMQMPINKNSKVCDYCAGTMGKTMMIADVFPLKELVACDIDIKRLNKGLKRLKENNINNVKMQEINPEFLRQNENYFDVVIIDVPCSGSGVWRRSPDNKRRINLIKMQEILKEQENILGKASKLVSKGGVLFYSTCSLINDENKMQIEKFLKNNKNLSLLREIYFSPLKTNTDGFFGAILTKL